MPKPTKGPRLGGSSSHQKAMLANLATSLFEHGRIKTTETKARALRPYAEKLITHAKKGTLHNRREVLKKIRDKDVVHTLFAEIGPFFADRNGGYTRIIKVEARKGDNAPMAVIELVQEKTVTSEANRARRASASKKAAPAEAAAAPRQRSSPEAAVGSRGSTEAVEDVAEAPRRPSRTSRPRTRPSRTPRPPRPRLRSPTLRLIPTRMPTSPSGMNDVPAIDSGGGHVRLRLDIAYDGTEFAGWAVQAGQRTVAGVLDDALTTVFRTPVQLRAAGRTDAGVHATGQVAHVDVPTDALGNAYPRTTACRSTAEFLPLVRRLARFLPADVRVRDIVRAPEGFDARFSALRRHYVYRLSTAPYGVEPQRGALRDRVAAPAGRRRHGRRLAGPGGTARLRRVLPAARRRHHHPRPAAAGLVTRRRSDRAHVTADAFCWSMVRSLVGALLAVGEHRREPGWCAALLTSTRRSSDFAAAPPQRPDAGRRGLPARRPARGAHQGHPRSAGDRLVISGVLSRAQRDRPRRNRLQPPATKSAAWFTMPALMYAGARWSGQYDSQFSGSVGLQMGSSPWHNSMVLSL